MLWPHIIIDTEQHRLICVCGEIADIPMDRASWRGSNGAERMGPRGPVLSFGAAADTVLDFIDAHDPCAQEPR